MNDYEMLHRAILTGLAEHYGISEYDYRNNSQLTNPALCRSHLYKLMLIELYLHEHRSRFKNSVLHLDGVSALHHLVFLKTHWMPEKIRQMDSYDLLWTLLDELVPGKLSDKAQSYLQTISNNQLLIETELMNYEGWEIGSGGRYLKNE